MPTTPRATPQWIIAVIAMGFVLYALRDALAPFALAFTLFLAIDGLARWIKAKVRFMPFGVALVISLGVILGSGFAVIAVLARNITTMAESAGLFQARIEAIGHQIKTGLGIGGPDWTFRGILAQVGPNVVLARLAQAVQTLAGSTVLILIYLLFLFPAGSVFPKKLHNMLPTPEQRRRAADTLTSIRVSIERYLVLQTGVSLLISVLSYATLAAIGLNNALFWTFLIFFLNYIPTIGSIIAVGLPTLFAMVQYDDWRYVAAVALGLHIWQFGIGTFVQPRLTGSSLNLSAIVVLLSLALWGALWGIAGVFLAAPLTVMLMIVLDQFDDTRWIAVLLSADGRPSLSHIHHRPPKEDPEPKSPVARAKKTPASQGADGG